MKPVATQSSCMPLTHGHTTMRSMDTPSFYAPPVVSFKTQAKLQIGLVDLELPMVTVAGVDDACGNQSGEIPLK